MNKYLLLLAIAFLTVQTPAQTLTGVERDNKIKSVFGEIKKISKGALGLNMYQTTTGRIVVMQNGSIVSPPKNNLITVAFRNEKATELSQLGFYIGNRYGSNYWELHNAFVATAEEQAMLAFNHNHAALRARADAKPMAYLMAQHQMLELFYMQKSPTSTLTKSYMQRGVADNNHEILFYRLFADYMALHIQNEADYLIFLEFQKRSSLLPGKKTVSLSAVRQLVADISAKFDLYMAPDKASEFRRIRNSIHNGLTKDAIGHLSQFKSANSSIIAAEDMTSYANLQAMIISYFSIDKESMNILLPSINVELPAAAAVLAGLSSSGNNLAKLLELSELAVTARKTFERTRNIDTAHLIIRIQDFIQAELGKISTKNPSELSAKAASFINLSYATGYFNEAKKNDLLTALNANPESSISLISQALSEGVMRFETVFQPALTDWKLVSTSVASFVDEGIRSSSLISLDSVLTLLKEIFPGSGSQQTGFSIENAGVGYGYLIFIPRDQTEKLVTTLTFKMIPVFEMLPLDLGVVAGVITEEPQTPLSHVNIKSKNRGTPNVYVNKASQDPRIKNLLEKKALVRLELKDGVMSIREVALAEAEAFWSARNDKKPIIKLRSDLNEKRIRSTKDLGFNDVISVGAKAANYAESTHILPDAFRPGFAIPFFYYREFIQTNMFNAQLTIDQYLTQLVNDPRIKTDRQFLVDSLVQLQTRMRADDMIVNQNLVNEVKTAVDKTYPNAKIRLRSSTNSEDMPQFTGAGLYDSDSYDLRKPKKTIDKALKTVWASVWNLRAFDEREMFGINHLDVSMAMLISPAFPNEIANGVGVGRNIIDPKLGPAVYLNIQQGSEAVTNPNPDLTPDQVLVLLTPDRKNKTKYTLKYLKYSSLTKTEPVLPYHEVERIADILLDLQKHFFKIYHPKRDNPKFALDVEFKVDIEEGPRKVHFKQARPFIGD